MSRWRRPRRPGSTSIVIDHHAAEPQLPRAFAVVNPNRLDESEPASPARRRRRRLPARRGAEPRAARRPAGSRAAPSPTCCDLLDLVALGTVCDVVPLTGLNRALVAQGLKVHGAGAQSGPRGACRGRAARASAASAYHLGFVLGPRVNAGGRVGAADLGARLLTTDDPVEARALAAAPRRAQPRAPGDRGRRCWRPRMAQVGRQDGPRRRWCSSPARAGIPASSASSPAG